jgi:hypothetical protein
MDMIPVRREQFIAFGYDPMLKELRIYFKASIYTYTEVPSHIYDAFFMLIQRPYFITDIYPPLVVKGIEYTT